MTTALVLGAGSSVCFGYPTGEGLRDLILGLERTEQHQFVADAVLNYDPKGFSQFLKAFRHSDEPSIDAFLARRDQFSEIGKRCVAAVLLRLESSSRLYVDKNHDTWAAYFKNILSRKTWDELAFDKFKIITFNYDRAFEHYLVSALRYTYGRSEEEMVAKLQELEIVHIYGSLGPTWPGSTEYIPYGPAVIEPTVRKVANSLKVIPEGRDDEPTLIRARQILRRAKRIAFLGFGFDETNMARLEAKETCKSVVTVGGVRKHRKIAASCMKMTVAEAKRAHAYFGKYDPERGLPPDFVDGNCLQTLRETLILG